MLSTISRSVLVALGRAWPRNIVDRVLLVGIAFGFLVYLRMALLTEYAFNDWAWVAITHSPARWLQSFSAHASVRVTSQALLGASFSLFGDDATVPAFILAIVNLLGVVPAARLLQKFGLSSRAAWLGAACSILCSANGDVVIFLAQSETAVGRTLVLVTLDRALENAPGALWRAIPWLFLSFLTHEGSLYVLPLLVLSILVMRGWLALGLWLKRRETLVFAIVDLLLTIARLGLAASTYDPHGNHALDPISLPGNITYWANHLLTFLVQDRLLPLMIIAAIVLGVRAQDIDWKAWLGRVVPGSIVGAIVGYTIYFLATGYQSNYFFLYSAVAAGAPLGWLGDRALSALEKSTRQVVMLAVVIVLGVVAPVLGMPTFEESRHALRLVRRAAEASIQRAPQAPVRCVWIVSPNGHAETKTAGPLSAIIDVDREKSTMLTLLHPTTEFVIVELRPDQLAQARTSPEDVIIRFDPEGRGPRAEVPLAEPADRPKNAAACAIPDAAP